MPKMKTRKSIIKKIKVTGSGKLKTRATGQNHYNSRNTGNQTRAKRVDNDVYPAVAKNIKQAILHA
ncbi:MAG TPA: 50S ribosomal protein L35 [Patescibacteria group bacterium]|nr:50S ribosomal protein L35 [Patescibacteria group bacterium]